MTTRILTPKRKIDLSFDFCLDDRNFVSSSTCIIKHPHHENQYIAIVRCNHFLGVANVCKGSKTNNYILYLNKEFEILEKKIIHNIFLPNKDRDGIEDIKLFYFDNKIYYIGTFKSNNDKTTSNIFEFPNVVDTLKENIITVSFRTNYTTEKNWAFVNYKSRLCLVYRWYPLQIGEIEYTNNKLILLEEKPTPQCFRDVRGSSCGVLYDGFIWFIVHERFIQRNRQVKYLHMFVVFDEDMKLIKFSEHFTLEIDREFAYGLLIENNEIIVSYSTNNSTSNISIFDYNYIQCDIQWTTL